MKKYLLFAVLAISFSKSQSQNVGVNLTAPQFPMDILKTGGGHLLRLTNPSNTTGSTVGFLLTNTSGYTSPTAASVSIYAERKVNGGNDLIFANNINAFAPLERMRMDSAGNFLIKTGSLGIGTYDPSYDLHIYKTDPTIGFYDVDDDQQSGLIEGDSSDLIITAHRRNTLVTGDAAGNLLLQVNGTGLFPLLAGSIGIGTYTPTAKLHVAVGSVMIGSGSPAAGYLLSVNGRVISEEVRVELDVDWPDYVFDKSYKLPSIAWLEQYLKANKHLPNIPSASTVKNEGFDLGDMNRRLLEKIEELTLYIIDQNKRIEELDKKVDQLQRTNKSGN